MEDSGLLKAILEHVADGIVIVDTDGLILSANPSACKLFDYAADELSGQPASMLMSPKDSLRLQAAYQQHSQAGTVRAVNHCSEVKAIRKHGGDFPARLSVSQVRYQGRELYTAVIHDLSEEKKTEEKREQYTSGLEAVVEERTKFLKNIVDTLEKAKGEVNTSLIKEKEVHQLKTRFVSLASHEFRTPLSAIQLSASLIERYYDRIERTQVFKHLQKIKLAVADLTSILEDFLSVERIDSGKIEPAYGEFDLQLLCAEIKSEMQALAKRGQTISCDHSGMTTVLLDRNLLRHCLANLLSNAIKYSGDRGLIELQSVVTGNGCRITVSDNGIGIPDADQAQLFGVFFRATNTAGIQGTGLGLNLVKRYADLMQGEISFESREGSGSSFTLSFRRAGASF